MLFRSVDLPMVLIVSQVEVINSQEGGSPCEIEGLGIEVRLADGEKCERCWTFSDTVGKDSNHPTLCDRCAAIIG